MAVAFDAVGPAGGGGAASATTPLTWAHVNGGNAILVGATSFGGNTNKVTAVTYGGVTIPFLAYIPSNNGANGGVALYGLVSASLPSGSNTVSVAFTGGGNTIGGSVSYTGAGSLSAATTNFGTGSGTFTSTAIVTNAGGILAAAACYGTTGGTWGVTGGNLRWSHNTSGGSGSDNGGQGDIASTGASQTIIITNNTGTDDWGIVAVEVIPGGPTSGPALPSQPRAQRPVIVVSNAGWRSGQHSR